MDEITQKLAKEWKNLPRPLQKFVLNGGWEDKLSLLGERFGLQPDQAYQLKIEVALVLFGLENPADLATNVKETLPATQISDIISSIRREIFQEIDGELNKLNTELDIQDQMINERMEKLPLDLQQAINSTDNEQIIQEIGKRHHLHIDQIGELDNEIWQVMLGLEPAANFTTKIQARLGISQNEAEQIAGEVNSEIFLPIRESLKQIEENRDAPEKLSIFERKLSEAVNLKPTDQTLTINPDVPAAPLSQTSTVHFDPYHEPLD